MTDMHVTHNEVSVEQDFASPQESGWYRDCFDRPFVIHMDNKGAFFVDIALRRKGIMSLKPL